MIAAPLIRVTKTMETAPRPADATDYALNACRNWLKGCLDVGWKSEHMEALEGLWWKHHDKNGDEIVTQTPT